MGCNRAYCTRARSRLCSKAFAYRRPLTPQPHPFRLEFPEVLVVLGYLGALGLVFDLILVSYLGLRYTRTAASVAPSAATANAMMNSMGPRLPPTRALKLVRAKPMSRKTTTKVRAVAKVRFNVFPYREGLTSLCVLTHNTFNNYAPGG